MSTATLLIKPLQVRMMNEREAATYLGIPVKRFQSLGIQPVEIIPGVRTYDIHDLDDRINLIKSGSFDGDDAIIGRL